MCFYGRSPSGDFLLVDNQFSNDVVVFKIEKGTGKLTKPDKEIKVKIPSSIQMYT
ncbi:beta-propeller fold lactonase family protein [Cognatitamlana onchidii]|uniref:beta-propeller fold lactonase family protein n=1 Tax=Cognatitamlana onchidii TaxID=2562860 RepID=UPI0010A6054E